MLRGAEGRNFVEAELQGAGAGAPAVHEPLSGAQFLHETGLVGKDGVDVAEILVRVRGCVARPGGAAHAIVHGSRAPLHVKSGLQGV